MTLRIKANRSSMFRGDMGCRNCNTKIYETQEHLQVCPGLAHEQRGLNIDREQGKLIFWQRMAPKLKELANEDSLKEFFKKAKKKPNKGY